MKFTQIITCKLIIPPRNLLPVKYTTYMIQFADIAVLKLYHQKVLHDCHSCKLFGEQLLLAILPSK